MEIINKLNYDITSNGFIASAISPSVLSPSVAITTTAFFPSALNRPSTNLIVSVTSRMCLQRGVPPLGA